MKILSFSLRGPKEDNQDTVYFQILPDGTACAAIADGVGGMGGGKAASLCVERGIIDAIKMKNFDPLKALQLAHEYVNQLDIPTAATTAIVVTVKAHRLLFAHTGDSRISILRSNGLLTLTVDQTEVAVLVKEGVLTKADAKSYRRRNVLTHAVEKGQELLPQVGEFPIADGDRILLVTDGIYKVIEKDRIRDLSIVHRDADEFANAMEDLLVSNLVDDASIVIIDA
jgi:serine/threonine protein phosphatase PrpC